MEKLIKDMTTEEVTEEHSKYYKDVGRACSRYALNKLLELERELTLREEQS